jgi:hypothetical protein
MIGFGLKFSSFIILRFFNGAPSFGSITVNTNLKKITKIKSRDDNQRNNESGCDVAKGKKGKTRKGRI